MSIESLVQRFLEDRSSLAPTELDALIAGLRVDPQLAASLRDQLVIDDLLAQKFALDRRNFEAQVAQRVADFERGQERLEHQVADLRAMALAEQRQSFKSGRRRWPRYVLALAAVLLVGLALYPFLPLRERRPPLATVSEVRGEVKLERDGESVAVEVDSALKDGERIIVPRDAMIALRYLDATSIRVSGESAFTLGGKLPTLGKQLRIDRGEVVATVTPQKFGDMQLATPHAVARVNSGELRLFVVDENTVLDVSQGQVHFDVLADNRSIPVNANETGSASHRALQVRQLTWPDRRDGLTYLLSPLEKCEPDNDKPLMVARNPLTRNLRVTQLEPHGAASLLDSRPGFELNGGFLISADAGPDILANTQHGNELTLEAIFSPASLDQTGPARIVSLADDNDPPNFMLSQDGSELSFLLRTDADIPKDLPRLTVQSSVSPLHLTITYRSGELVAYLDGMESARCKDLLGSSLAPWRSGPLTAGADASGARTWRGILEAFAVYNRCLDASEVARNARNYRLLAGRGMYESR
jgi:ferric-dicitrate binding protein FerR (iron transport regulator)